MNSKVIKPLIKALVLQAELIQHEMDEMNYGRAKYQINSIKNSLNALYKKVSNNGRLESNKDSETE